MRFCGLLWFFVADILQDEHAFAFVAFLHVLGLDQCIGCTSRFAEIRPYIDCC